jgi:hypothetical protein
MAAGMFSFALVWVGGCGSDSGAKSEIPTFKEDISPDGKADSSVVAVFLKFEFDAELVTNSTYMLDNHIENQLLYTIGQLNGEDSVSRMDQVQITDLQTTEVPEGIQATYHAEMLVAWGRRDQIPHSYTLMLPKDISYQGLQAFTEKYRHDCVDWGAHDVDVNSMWYYYRPDAYSCELEAADIVRAEATVTTSIINTTGKYPEYHEIWKDDSFRAVVIFGKFEEGATSNSDPGIASFNTFVSQVHTSLGEFDLITTPEDLPPQPGVDAPDVTLEASLPGGKKVHIVALLIDNVRTAGPTFDTRYAELTGQADFIAYNGHSGLGANIRALAQKGSWESGQYVIVFMNGCDTYAYVDSALYDSHVQVNPDDPKGTKYMDMIMNAMPSPSRLAGRSSVYLINAWLSYEQPMNYEQIFTDMNPTQVILVSGEEDNVYYPGYVPDPPRPEPWEGMEESGQVAKDKEMYYQTPVLKEGTYLFKLTGTGDADLYVRIGMQPTPEFYDCRPYLTGSVETCRVELTQPTAIYLMVRGWDSQSEYRLVGKAE